MNIPPSKRDFEHEAWRQRHRRCAFLFEHKTAQQATEASRATDATHSKRPSQPSRQRGGRASLGSLGAAPARLAPSARGRATTPERRRTANARYVWRIRGAFITEANRNALQESLVTPAEMLILFIFIFQKGSNGHPKRVTLP